MSSNNIKRILLKLSGEALLGDHSFGVDPKVLNYLAEEIQSVISKGIEIGIVIGGGNIFRGEGLAQSEDINFFRPDDYENLRKYSLFLALVYF